MLPRTPQPTKVVLETEERILKSKLQAAIFSASNVDESDPEAIRKIALDLKEEADKYYRVNQKLVQWYKDHGHSELARHLRKTRHGLVFHETNESIEDLNQMLTTLSLEAISNVEVNSVCSSKPAEALEEPLNSPLHVERSNDRSQQHLIMGGGGFREYEEAVFNARHVEHHREEATAAKIVNATCDNLRRASDNHIDPHRGKDSAVQQNFHYDEHYRETNHIASQPERGSHHHRTINVTHEANRRAGNPSNENNREDRHTRINSEMKNSSQEQKYDRSSSPYRHQQNAYHQDRMDPHIRYTIKQDLLRGGSVKFDGDPQHFLTWKQNLSRRIRECEPDSLDSIHILLANTAGRPHTMVQHFYSAGISDPDTALRDIWRNLESRFASNRRIADNLIGKINSTVPIKNAKDFHKLEDFLDTCKIIHSNMSHCPELNIFNYTSGMKQVWQKLPEVFQSKWHARYYTHEVHVGFPPDFGLFIEFFEGYLKQTSHPAFASSSYPPANRQVRTLAVMNEVREGNDSGKHCFHHNVNNHDTSECKSFSKLPYKERKQFVIEQKLCYMCLKGTHFSGRCPDKDSISCNKCNLKHCTAMHYEKSADSAKSSKSGSQTNKANSQTGSSDDNSNPISDIKNACANICGSERSYKICSKTLAVDLSHGMRSEVLRCLCVIDEQSNASFCDPRVVEYFDLSPVTADYKLTTMTSTTSVSGYVVNDLQIKGVRSGKWLDLPSLFTNPNLPNTSDEIASPQIVSSHSHIRNFAKHFPDIDPKLEVMILLGADAGDFMSTKCYGSHFPFVHKTPLGYALVGPSCSNKSVQNPVVKTLRTAINIDCNHTDSKMVFPNDVCPAKSDIFALHVDDYMTDLSQEDQQFTKLMEREVTVNSKGNLQFPLPLKREIQLPDNKHPVYFRTKNTLDRLKRTPERLTASLDVLGKYLAAGHVEEIPPTEVEKRDQSINYVPIFPVYNESKGKLRLVFDSSATFAGVSLNDAVMQGPDLTNSLLGVLLRFRLGEVAATADIECMFHSFYVDPRHCDLLRFFLVPGKQSSEGNCTFSRPSSCVRK